MRFVFAIVAYLVIAGLMGYGMLLSVRGNWWFLIAILVVYALAFARLGCLNAEKH